MKKSKKKKPAVFIIILCILLACAVIFVAGRGIKSAPEITYTVHSEVVLNVIEIAGNISAAKEQKLQAPGDGTVMAVYAAEGDKVKKGSILVQIDDTEQRYNLARLDYDIAQKRLSGAPRELELLYKQRLVLLQRINDRQITAGFDGVLAQFSAKTGDVVEAKDSVGILLDRTYLTATVEVVETDAPKLVVGQKAILKFPANNNQPLEGYVFSFPAVGSKTSRGAAVVAADVRIDDPPDIILPSFSFTGEIEITPPQTFLLLERQAIEFVAAAADGTQAKRGDSERGGSQARRGGAAPGRQAFAEKIDKDGNIERVAVDIKPYGRDFVQILSGLEEGDVLRELAKDPPSGRNASGVPAQTGQQRSNQAPVMVPSVPFTNSRR
ncbi:MAG: hypothetical protein Ta2B_11550 [Termitinemataceae bacterium]|nr:MAG: hypothetical protein Ta2B_11550 [Termitinemataceae bacterium]